MGKKNKELFLAIFSTFRQNHQKSTLKDYKSSILFTVTYISTSHTENNFLLYQNQFYWL